MFHQNASLGFALALPATLVSVAAAVSAAVAAATVTNLLLLKSTSKVLADLSRRRLERRW